jgi:S1-C subfamily serine protease
MKRAARIGALLLGALFVGSLPAAAKDAAPFVVDDQAVVRDFTRQLEALKDAGQTVDSKELIGQLKRTRARVSLPSPSRRTKEWDEVYRASLPGVVIVGRIYLCSKCTRWHLSAASGAILTREGVMVTNYHVVDNPDGVLGAMTSDGKVYAVKEVLAASEKDDVAILRLAAEGDVFTPLSLRLDAPVGAGVGVISHPTSYFYTFSEGTVSRYFKGGDAKARVPRMAITADYAKGSSGAPVLDAAGNLVGLACTTQSIYYGEKDGHQENLQAVIKACVPALAIRKLLE